MNNQTVFIKIVLALVLLSMPTFCLAEIPNDTLYNQQWYLEQVDATGAWDIETGSNDVVIAVLDVGIDLDHPDLKNNIWQNTGEIAGNNIDDDENGYIDDVDGWDFIDKDNSPVPDISSDASVDAISHGSLIAGIIGAEGNNIIGVTGVNWNVKIMPVRMLNKDGAGNSVEAIKAINYAVDNGADVINMSFAGDVNDPNLRDAVRNAYEKGVVVVSALGNDSVDVNSLPVYPACYKSDTDDWVIGVASLGKLDKISSFSNYGSDCVDLSAPGEEIFGINYFNQQEGYYDKYDGGWYGTSMASPIVAGAVGLLIAKYPDLTPTDVRNILKLSVDPLNLDSEYVGKFGAGRLNINNALAMAGDFSNINESEYKNSENYVGYYVKAPSFDTVYYVTEDNGRRAFINSEMYFTYTDSFSEIQEITDDELSAMKLEGLMLPNAGVVLIKIQSNPRVYAIEGNVADEFFPILREIPDEQIAIDLYGEDWADYVIDIEPTFFYEFVKGRDMNSSEIVNTAIMKKRNKLISSN